MAPRRTGDDPRVARTTHALGQALIDLVQERGFDAITVQEILERAGVARATFYAHYRNKEDVLHSSYERLFIGMERALEQRSPLGERLFPVAEFVEHLADAGPLMDALRRDGQLDELWRQFVGYAARIIERRLQRGPWSERRAAEREAPAARALSARMLAGALAESITWWEGHREAMTPMELDRAFHRLALAL